MAEADQKVEDAGSETEEEVEEKAEERPKEEEIPVRQKPWSNRQERAEFFKSKGKKEKDEGEEEDEELTPAAARAVQRELKKALDPFTEVISRAQADSDINSYLAGNPNFRKYEAQARKWMEKHPTLTAESAFLLATKGKVEEDKEAKERDEEKAKRGSLGGGTVRKEVSALPTTEAEMKKAYELVKRGKTVKLGE